MRDRASELFGRVLLARLGELEPAGAVLSAPYSVEGILSSDALSAYAELYGARAWQTGIEYRRTSRRLNAATLVGREALGGNEEAGDARRV